MTTEHKPTAPKAAHKKPAPWLALSHLEWKLYLTAALATGYVVVWLVAAPGAATGPSAADPSAPANAAHPGGAPAPNVWASDQRSPPAEPPPRATARSTATPTPTVVRVPTSKPARVRTRTS